MRTLVLLRHAHRNTFDVAGDNGLSERGHEQAARVESLFRGRFSTVDTRQIRLICSPKLRCRETLEPIARFTGQELETDARLTEGGSMESSARFIDRIQSVLRDWAASSDPLWILCSHGDWIPAALDALVGKHFDVPKAAWVEVTDREDGSFETQIFRCD